jgi:hypothetical protein
LANIKIWEKKEKLLELLLGVILFEEAEVGELS